MRHTYDLIIIGAGPAGIEAGLAASEAGLDFLILERGRIAENMRRWGFVSMFSPWSMNLSSSGEKHLDPKNVDLKDIDRDSFPTGAEYIKHYLQPLAEHQDLDEHIIKRTNVLKIGRAGAFKNTLIGDSKRAKLPFVILAEQYSQEGTRTEVTYLSHAVIDASGVYGNHRWLGLGGIPCLGEREYRRYISYEVADIEPIVKKSELHLHLVIVGSGFSACTLLESAKALNESGHRLNISWITADTSSQPIPVVENDPLPYRARLAQMTNKLAESPPEWLNYKPGYCIVEIKNTESNESSATITLKRLDNLDDQEELVLIAQQIFALIGYTPDRRIYEELQVHECWATSGPMKLAASLLSQQGADCLSLQADGETLVNPEPNFFIIGAKSYGRNSNFLIDRLKEQVASVVSMLVSDNK